MVAVRAAECKMPSMFLFRAMDGDMRVDMYITAKIKSVHTLPVRQAIPRPRCATNFTP